MTFGCKHHFQYAQGHFRCSKCGKRGKERQYKRNHNKSYATIVIIGIIIIGGIYVYGNYDITVDNQKIDPMISLKTVEQKFDELYQTIPTESIDSAIQEFSDSIPIKIEQKPTKLEDKLLDCSKYKREYLEANKDVRTTEDNMAAMMGDALAGVQKTKACEEHNNKILTEAGVLGHCQPPFTLDLDNSDGEATMSYKERFIKYCGQAEWDYINER